MGEVVGHSFTSVLGEMVDSFSTREKGSQLGYMVGNFFSFVLG